ncbi:MAG: hypothetical protein MJ198_00225 [Bacteroidales bacterium]|nr:hypothetical protein [Bacteroidales bacterium]
MKKVIFKIVILLGGLLVSSLSASSQVLVAGTDFSCAGKEKDAYASVDDITGWLGILQPQISVSLPLTKDANVDTKKGTGTFVDGKYYAITNNPAKLDSFRLYDNKEDYWGLVLPKMSENTTMLTFSVAGLKPAAKYTVEVEYAFVASYSEKFGYGYPGVNYNTGSKKVEYGGIDPKIKLIANPDQYNTKNGTDVGFSTAQKESNGIATATSFTQNAVGADGKLTIYVNSSQQTSAIMIKSIKVYGSIDPTIYSIDGAEVCAGDFATLELKGTYSNVKFQWYKDNKAISGATTATYAYETPTTLGKSSYYLEVTSGTTTFKSNTLSISTIKCCEITLEDGTTAPASRKVIFKEDFGEFDIDNDPKGMTYKVWDYSDISNPKQVVKKTATPFRYPLNPAPLGCDFKATSSLGDGDYCVAGVLTQYNGTVYNGTPIDGAKLEWAGRIGGLQQPVDPSVDHSGELPGCALFINCKPNTGGKSLYTRTIDNLCQNRQLFYECYITVFTNSANGKYNPVDVTIRMTEKGNTSNYSEARGTATIQSEGGTGTWVKISGDIFLEKSDAVILDVINNSNVDQNGNDLVVDDIIIKACSSPSIQAYYDLKTFDSDTATCSGEGIRVFAKVSEMLKQYFGGINNTYFQYQYSTTPDVKTSWKNVGPMTVDEQMDVSSCQAFKDAKDGDVIFFRVVAGGKWTMENTAESAFNPDDPCASYAISSAIPTQIVCPTCKNPKTVSITAKQDLLCPDEEVELTVTAQEDATTFNYTWYKGSIDNKNILASKDAATLPLTVKHDDISEEQTYIVLVKDINYPTATSCQTQDEVVIKAKDAPSVTISGGETICEGEDFTKPVKFTFVGEEDFTFTYSDGTKSYRDVIPDANPYLPALSTTAGTNASYTITALKDKYCEATTLPTNKATIVVNANPTASLTADKNEICEGEGTIQLSATSSTGSTIEWKKDGKTFTNSAATKMLSAVTESGTYSIQATANSCVSEISEQTVTINKKPEILTLTSDKKSVCSGETITLSATVSDDGSGEFSWTGDDAISGTGSTVTISKTVTKDTEVTITLAYKNGCDAKETKTIKVTFYAVPAKPSVKDLSYCVDDTPSSLEATAVSGAVLNWYGTNEIGGTATTTAPTPSTAKTNVGKTYYYVSQTLNGCESEREKATVTVDDTLAPVINAVPGFEVCENVNVALSVEGSFSTTTWSGSGASKLDAASISTPTFSKASAGSYVIKVSVVDTKGCKGSATKSIVVNPIPEVSLSDLSNKCVSDETAQTLTATITPAGTKGEGTWTGKVTKASETTATFTPSVAEEGKHTIKYDFVSEKGCVAAQKSTSVEVYALPTPTIKVSNANVCVSDNNSDEVTVSTTGTAAAGTFAYSVDNSGKINAENGTFDPKANSAGTYTITLNYTDPNGCKGSATDQITVNALPTVTITNPGEICYNADKITIGVSVEPQGGTGVWTGTASATDATFDPKNVNPGTADFKYVYTDKNKCQNSNTSSINVVSVEKPTVSSDYQPKVVIVNSGSLSTTTELVSSATTSGDELQWTQISTPDNDVAKSWAPGENTFQTGLTETSEDGSYVYLVREYKMVDGKACYSDSVTATLVISNCEALPPAAEDKYICVLPKEATAADKAKFSTELVATRTPSSVDDYKISWLSIDPAGKMGTEADANILADVENYVPTIDLTTIADYSYYVAEFDKTKTCWSAGRKVTIHVVDTPSVTISSPANICAKGSELVPVTVTPQNGTLTEENSKGSFSGLNWMPGDYTGASLEATFVYVVESQKYADNTTCTSTVKSTTTAHFMEKPEGSKPIWLISEIASIPDDLLKATRTSTGKTMKWYETKSMSSELSPVTATATGSTYALDKTALKAEVGTSSEYHKSFWVTQTNEHGCESEPAEVTLSLLDCPWEAPKVDSIQRCLNTQIGNLTATEGNSVETMAKPGSQISWIWFDENGDVISGSTSNVLVPVMVKNTEAKVSKFSVAYEAVEATSGVSCQSPKTDVTITVLPLPEITIETPSTICYTTEETKIIASNTSANGTTTATWTAVTGDVSEISDNGIFYAQANGRKAGEKEYSILYEVVDAKTCKKNETISVKVLYLPPVETKGFYALTGQEDEVIVKATSTLENGAAVKWLSSSTLINDQVTVGTGVTFVTDDNPDVEIKGKKYYARQFVDECYSEPTEAIVAIENCPIPEVVISDEEECLYNGAPELSAEGGLWNERPEGSVFNYYSDADMSNKVGSSSDGTFVPTDIKKDSEAKEYYYYVTETNSNIQQFKDYGIDDKFGCESKPVKVTVTMKKTASPVVSFDPKEVCFKEETPKFVATQVSGEVYWYEENPGEEGEPQASSVKTGRNFTPEFAPVGSQDIWAVSYNNGCYSNSVKATYKVNAIPEKPTVYDAESCYAADANELKAEGESGAILTWYADKDKKKILYADADTYVPTVEEVEVYSYFVTQKVNGCESPVAEVKYEIIELPLVPIVLESPTRLCEYNESATMKVSGENIKWYADANKTEMIETAIDDVCIIDDMSVGVHKYFVTQTIRGCEGAVKMISYQVYPTPEQPKTTGGSICAGDTDIPMLTTDMQTDKWYDDQDNFKGEGYVLQLSADEIGAKDVVLYVQRERNGCLSEKEETILHVIEVPSFTIGEDMVLCTYDETPVIQADNFKPVLTEKSFVEWKISNGTITKNLVDNAEHNISPSNMLNTAGDYTISAVFACRYDERITCRSNSISVNYSVKAQPRTPIVFTKTICQGEKIDELQALGSPNVVWHSLSGTLPEEFHGPKYKFQVGQTLDTGVYKYEIYDLNLYDEENLLGCESVHDTVEMVVAPGANTRLYGKDSVCLGAVGESYYTQYESTSQYFWTVTGDNLNYSKDATSTSVRYIDWMAPGIDTIMVYEQTWAGCEGFDTLVVKVAPVPKAHFSWSMPGASNVIELVDSTIQDSLWTTDANGDPLALPVTYTMAWNYGHQGTPDSQIDTIVPYNQRNFPLQEGGYLYGFNCPILTVTNDFGCSDTYTECIFVNISSSLYVPNAFSPTNPAHSVRSFQPKGFNLSTCEVSVYDKWGNLLWYSDEVEDGMFKGSWDGRYDGKMMKSDVYVWKIEATFLDGQKWQGFDAGNGKKTKFGSVTLVR